MEENSLLGQKIDALKELTDVKFQAINKTLERIELNTQSFITVDQFEENKKDTAKSLKDVMDILSNHFKDDTVSFGKIDKKQDKVQMIVLLASGGLMVIVFAIQYIIPLLLNK